MPPRRLRHQWGTPTSRPFGGQSGSHSREHALESRTATARRTGRPGPGVAEASTRQYTRRRKRRNAAEAANSGGWGAKAAGLASILASTSLLRMNDQGAAVSSMTALKLSGITVAVAGAFGLILPYPVNVAMGPLAAIVLVYIGETWRRGE